MEGTVTIPLNDYLKYLVYDKEDKVFKDKLYTIQQGISIDIMKIIQYIRENPSIKDKDTYSLILDMSKELTFNVLEVGKYRINNQTIDNVLILKS